jgi:tripartite-type tricarboxylate transporter receptor subunit TctC
MRLIKTVTAIAAAVAASVTFAQATPAYPNKPIKLIIPFAPGGSTDIVGRIMAAKLTPLLGQPVIVENKAGAGGSIGAAEIAKAPADGYTIGMGSVSTMGTNIVAYKNNKLDPNTQFTHITNLASVPGIIIVNKNFPHQDYKSFVAALKANPGKFSYASSGAGGVGHLAMELFLVETGTDAQHIAYKGAGPAVTDVLAGNVPIMWDNLSSSLAQIKAGNFIPIGLAFPKRIPQLPNVPTFAELGLKNYEADTWFGLVGPANLPKDIVKKLYDASIAALKDPDTVKKLEENGAFVVGNTPEQFSNQIKQEVVKWKRVVDAKKISLDL